MADRWLFEYDEQGRLIRAVDQETGVTTTYEWHDASPPSDLSRQEEHGRPCPSADEV